MTNATDAFRGSKDRILGGDIFVTAPISTLTVGITAGGKSKRRCSCASLPTATTTSKAYVFCLERTIPMERPTSITYPELT